MCLLFRNMLTTVMLFILLILFMLQMIKHARCNNNDNNLTYSLKLNLYACSAKSWFTNQSFCGRQ